MTGKIEILKTIKFVEGHTVTINRKKSVISDFKLIMYKTDEDKESETK
ncbi:hypothetical protein OCA10_08805 [Bacillus cereus]|nr:hypothetical protein [Bacillus cereus]